MSNTAKELRDLAAVLEAKGQVGAVVCVCAAAEIDRLKTPQLADALEAHKQMLTEYEMRAGKMLIVLDDFVAHYPVGLNPSLDKAYVQARKIIAHDEV